MSLKDFAFNVLKTDNYARTGLIKTHRGNTWSKTGSSVHSVIKRMREREERIKFVRNKSFITEISDFKIKYKGEKI